MAIRLYVFGIALLTATTAAAQGQPKLEIETKQGNYYWVVETAPDGARRGGWVGVNVPLDAIDRSAFKPLPSAQAIAASERARPAPPAPSPSVDERLARIEQALVTGQAASAPSGTPRPAPAVATQVSQPRPQPPTAPQRLQTREGFWFNGGLGWGSAGCQGCLGREGGFSGGLSAGGVVSPRVMLGVGTSGWYKSVDGVTLTGGTFDGRVRFYPAVASGFFLTGGLGLGHISASANGFGSVTEYGVGALFGLGWDIRVGRNVSLTPFYNGFAVQTSNSDGNVSQLGLGVTIH